jgi:hypothetical protein
LLQCTDDEFRRILSSGNDGIFLSTTGKISFDRSAIIMGTQVSLKQSVVLSNNEIRSILRIFHGIHQRTFSNKYAAQQDLLVKAQTSSIYQLIVLHCQYCSDLSVNITFVRWIEIHRSIDEDVKSTLGLMRCNAKFTKNCTVEGICFRGRQLPPFTLNRSGLADQWHSKRNVSSWVSLKDCSDKENGLRSLFELEGRRYGQLEFFFFYECFDKEILFHNCKFAYVSLRKVYKTPLFGTNKNGYYSTSLLVDDREGLLTETVVNVKTLRCHNIAILPRSQSGDPIKIDRNDYDESTEEDMTSLSPSQTAILTFIDLETTHAFT